MRKLLVVMAMTLSLVGLWLAIGAGASTARPVRASHTKTSTAAVRPAKLSARHQGKASTASAVSNVSRNSAENGNESETSPENETRSETDGTNESDSHEDPNGQDVNHECPPSCDTAAGEQP